MLSVGAESQIPEKGTHAVAAIAAKELRSSEVSETASMIAQYPDWSAPAALSRIVS
jgi:hypothetical protein